MNSILIVEDTDSLRTALAQVLTQAGHHVETANSAESAFSKLEDSKFNLILCDLKLPGQSGLDVLKKSKVENPTSAFVIMTAYGTIDLAVEAMKFGAAEFITKPFDPEILCDLVEQILEHSRIVDRSVGVENPARKRFITQNESVEKLLSQARKVAALSSPVLILGESGTGKELIARYIHENSPRAAEQCVAVNCASMPSDLLESEFFGHEAGAFTGATEQRIGLFEVADKGTIFLDEIGNMPPHLQTKLLRSLQESEIKRLGSTQIKKVDVRVISATNCDLEQEITQSRFREDLYYRLGVVVLEIPPLRERRDDISLLATYFIKTIAARFNITPPALSPSVVKYLESYHWPGNVRELENAIERALILCEGTLTKDSFELVSPEEIVGEEEMTLPEAVSQIVKKTEVDIITKMLQRTYGNKTRAAELLGVSYKTLLNKIKEYHLEARP